MQSEDIFSIGKKLKWETYNNSIIGEEEGYQFTLQQDALYFYLYINLPMLTKFMVKVLSSFIFDVAEDWQVVRSYYNNSTYVIVFYAGNEIENTQLPKEKRFITVDEPAPITFEILSGYLEQLTHILRDNDFRNDLCIFCGDINSEEKLVVNGYYTCSHSECVNEIEKKLDGSYYSLSFGKRLLGVLGSIIGGLVGIALFIALSIYFPIVAGGAGYILGWLSYSMYKGFAGNTSRKNKRLSIIVSVVSMLIASTGVLVYDYISQPIFNGIFDFNSAFYINGAFAFNGLLDYIKNNASIYYIAFNLIIGLIFAFYGISSSLPAKLQKDLLITRKLDTPLE